MSKKFRITLKDLTKVEAELFVELRKGEIQKIRDLIKERFDSINKFSKTLGTSRGEISAYLARKHKMNLLLALEISKLLDIKLENIISKVTTRKKNGCFISVSKFPIKSSKELAMLVGHSFGDGHISKDSFAYTNKSEELINNVIESAQRIGFENVEPNRWFHKATTIRFSKIVRSIIILAGGPIGNKIVQNLKVPNWIKNASKEIKAGFLQALFDDEGSVKNNRSITLSLSKTKNLQENLREFLNHLRLILDELDVKGVKIRRGQDNFGKNGSTLAMILVINSTKNFIKFQKNIGFLHPRKYVLLVKMINSVRIIRTRNGEAKFKIINLLKNQKLTNKEIAKLLGMNAYATIEHLRDLEKKKLIERIKFSNRQIPHIWLMKNDKNYRGREWKGGSWKNNRSF